MQCSVNGGIGECLMSSSGPTSAEGMLVPVMKGPVRSGLELSLYSMLSHYQKTVRKHASVSLYSRMYSEDF